MFKSFFAAVILACSFGLIAAECPNACSAHGKCGAYDMCICYRNWMANDCSERICQFGLAHVDTPMGDLDASGGALTGPGTTVVTNDAVYPFGTPEQFPAMVDTDGTIVPNSAHYYRECSNKGICDRTSGDCKCFDGYDGSACQRASCPVSNGAACSGHGTCETIKTIAQWDNDNVYKLWDEDSTMGCVCDAGYSGPDCSLKQCKVGPDPLYYDDVANVRYSNYTYQIFTKTATTQSVAGNYSIIFYDSYGEDWETIPIDINANCDTVTNALEGLPNNVIPDGSVRCWNGNAESSSTVVDYQYGYVAPSATTNPIANFFIYTRFTIAFSQNFGRLKQIDINIHLDGMRPTLYSTESASTLGWHIFPNGYIGEYDDLVPDLCEGVLVTLTAGSSWDVLTPQNAQQVKALKKCLGDADGNANTFYNSDINYYSSAAGVTYSYNINSDVYQWDYGNIFNPHLIKLVEATQDNNVIGTSTPLNSQQLRDPSVYNYAITKLCTKQNTYLERISTANSGYNWCANENPPGFYAVLYFSGQTQTFNLWTRPSADYSTTQTFHVFTTQGYLQIVNPNVASFTNTDLMSAFDDVSHTHGRTWYAVNTTNVYAYQNFKGQLDCETAPVGSYGSLDCLNKNDYVLFFNNYNVSGQEYPGRGGTLRISAHQSNPVYLNMYKVDKISREQKTWTNAGFQNPNNEVGRHQLVVDYGSNSRYHYALNAAGPFFGQTAAAYKFHPAATYTYVSECSNHGICDQSSGLCQCFNGYTSDNCAVQNALAK